MKMLRYLTISRIFLHCHICGGHHQFCAFAGIFRIGRVVFVRQINGFPLMGTGRTFGQLPLIPEQHIKIAVIPFGGGGGPGAFNAAGNGVTAHTAFKLALPAKAHIFQIAGLRFYPDQGGVAGTVRFTKGMTACSQRYRLIIVHRHPLKGVANVPARRNRIRFTIRPFRINVNQAHLHGR